MTRTVVTIEERDGAMTARLAKAGMMVPGAREQVELFCTPGTLPPLDSPENVRAYGEAIRRELMKHPAISVVLQDIFNAPPGAQRVLCFEIECTQGESIRWEVLCDPQGRFLAVDGRCEIGRIAEDVVTREAAVRPFAPPLRIAAFLSAAGVDASPEWVGLSGAIADARAAGLAVEARVYVGQQTLLDEIQEAIGRGEHGGITAAAMPAAATDLEQELNAWPPHVVHFFCHGSAEYGTAYLELATLREHRVKAKTGSVVLHIDELVGLEGLRDAWMVVLNCCEGGQAVEQLHSMAYRVVAFAGVPAAIGMQEPVAAGDANAFSASLYPELFRVLRGVLQANAGAPPVVVDLTPAIRRPRRALRDRHVATPANCGRWTLPVLYLHDQPLQVHRPAAAGLTRAEADAIRERAEIVADFLRALPPEAPDAMREAMLARLDRPPAVPPALRPDRLGRFAADG